MFFFLSSLFFTGFMIASRHETPKMTRDDQDALKQDDGFLPVIRKHRDYVGWLLPVGLGLHACAKADVKTKLAVASVCCIGVGCVACCDFKENYRKIKRFYREMPVNKKLYLFDKVKKLDAESVLECCVYACVAMTMCAAGPAACGDAVCKKVFTASCCSIYALAGVGGCRLCMGECFRSKAVCKKQAQKLHEQQMKRD